MKTVGDLSEGEVRELLKKIVEGVQGGILYGDDETISAGVISDLVLAELVDEDAVAGEEIEDGGP